MKLPSYLETNEDVKAWEDYLMSLPKEELVGFMLDRMLIDNKLFDQVRMHFLHDDSGKEVREILKAFDNEISLAYKSKNVDTDFVIAITKHFIREIDALPENDIKEAYKHMADKLNDGVENYGLGWPDDYEVTELIKELSASLR